MREIRYLDKLVDELAKVKLHVSKSSLLKQVKLIVFSLILPKNCEDL